MNKTITQKPTNQDMEFIKTQKLISRKLIEFMTKNWFLNLPIDDQQIDNLLKGEFNWIIR